MNLSIIMLKNYLKYKTHLLYSSSNSSWRDQSEVKSACKENVGKWGEKHEAFANKSVVNASFSWRTVKRITDGDAISDITPAAPPASTMLGGLSTEGAYYLFLQKEILLEIYSHDQVFAEHMASWFSVEQKVCLCMCVCVHVKNIFQQSPVRLYHKSVNKTYLCLVSNK